MKKPFKDYIKSVAEASKNIALNAYEAGKQKTITGVDQVKELPGKGLDYTKNASKRLFQTTKNSLLENFGPQQMIRLATNNSKVGDVINDILFSQRKHTKNSNISDTISKEDVDETEYEKDASFSDFALNQINENLMSLEDTVIDGFKKSWTVSKDDRLLNIDRSSSTSITKNNQLALPNLINDAETKKVLNEGEDKEDDKIIKTQAKDIADIKKKLFEKVKDDKKTGLTPVERLQDMVSGGQDEDGFPRQKRRGRGKDRQPRKRRTTKAQKATITNPNSKYRSVAGNRNGNLLRQGLTKISRSGKALPQVASTASTAIAGRSASLLSGGASVATRALPALGGAGLGGGTAAGAAGGGMAAALAPLIAAIAAAVAGGGTGLYSLYKTVKGENPDNWISNLTNKGIQKVTGSDHTIGTGIYDALHDDTGQNKITKGSNTVKDKTLSFFSDSSETKEYKDSKTRFAPVNESNNIFRQMSDKVDSTTNTLAEKIKTFDIEKVIESKENELVMKDLKSNPNAFDNNPTYSLNPIPDTSADMVERHVTNDIREIKEQSQAPIIVAPPSTTVPTSLPAGKGSGGEDSVPLVTRSFDNVLKNITNQMLFQSLN